jgi:glycosyltransferase involved in cell wall biosynthesis
MKFSVLISLYVKEKPEYLEQALESVFSQTRPANEVVLVLDGPVTDELRSVVDGFKFRYPDILKVVPLEKNVGLGRALNEGLKHCSHEIVARMDTDDIAKPTRFSRQLEVLQNNQDIDIVGSWVDEFVGNTDNIIATRELPEDHDSLRMYAKRRSPINHPSVTFRKSAVIKAGGYEHFPLFEDYYLWVRMLMSGSKFLNITDGLTLMRVSPEMYKRRGGMKYARDEWRLQRKFREMGFISGREMALNLAIRTTVRLSPNYLRAFVYKKLLRSN